MRANKQTNRHVIRCSWRRRALQSTETRVPHYHQEWKQS